MWLWLMASVVAFLVGIAFVIGGIGSYRQHREERATWTRTSGKVVSIQERAVPGTRLPAYSPVVELTTSKGVVRSFLAGVGSRPASHTVGQAVPVLYDPNAPETAQIEMGSDWHLAGPQLAFGALFLTLGAAFAWLQFRPLP